MIVDKRKDKNDAKDRVRRRINSDFDRSKYKYIPEEKPIDFYDNEIEQRVGIYVRVSTDDIRQTTSFELQRKYYEDFVQKHPHWKLVKIYADEGISGTSTKKRDAFNQMVRIINIASWVLSMSRTVKLPTFSMSKIQRHISKPTCCQRKVRPMMASLWSNPLCLLGNGSVQFRKPGQTLSARNFIYMRNHLQSSKSRARRIGCFV